MRKINTNILQVFILLFCATVFVGCEKEEDFVEDLNESNVNNQNDLNLKSRESRLDLFAIEYIEFLKKHHSDEPRMNMSVEDRDALFESYSYVDERGAKLIKVDDYASVMLQAHEVEREATYDFFNLVNSYEDVLQTITPEELDEALEENMPDEYYDLIETNGWGGVFSLAVRVYEGVSGESVPCAVKMGAAVADFAVTAGGAVATGGALGVQAGILAANVYVTAYECYKEHNT